MRIQLSHNLKAEWPAIACSLGFALAMCGQMTAWALRGYTPFAKSIVFPAVPVLIALVLLLRSRWFVKTEFAVDKSFVAIPVLLLFFPFAIMAMIDPVSDKETLIYQTYLCILSVLVALNRREDFRYLPLSVLLIGGIGCVLPVMEFISSPLAALGRMTVSGSGNPLTVATNGAITFCAALIIGTKSGKNSVFVGAVAGGVALLGATNVVLSGTRSAMLGILLIIPVCAVVNLLGERRPTGAKPSYRRNLSFILTFVIAGAVLPTIAASILAPQLFKGMMTEMLGRIGTIAAMSGSGAHETSAYLHSFLLEYNWNGLTIWGHGVNAQTVKVGEGVYAHNIYLQGFYDLGLGGGLLLLIVAIVLPLALITLRRLQRGFTANESFIILIYVAAQFDQNFHGTPYSWPQWLPTLLVYLMFPPGQPSETRQSELSEPLQRPRVFPPTRTA